MPKFTPSKKNLKAPNASKGSGNSLLAYMIAQQKGQGLEQQLGPNATMVGGINPATGGRYETEAGQDMDVQNAGRKKAVTDAATAISALRKLIPVIDEFESGFKQAYPNAKDQFGVPGKLEAAKRIFLGKVLENDPEFAAFVDQLEGKRSQIAKGLGEVGNLAEQEQKIAMQNVPEFKMGGLKEFFLPEAPATGAKKLPKFRNFIEQQMRQNQDVIDSSGRFNEMAQSNSQEDRLAKLQAIKDRFKQRNP